MGDDEGHPTSDPERFARLKEGIEAHCPGMIVQLSTGGRAGAGHARGGMLPLRPDMALLSVGSNNFPTRDYENPPDLVDWLAAEMIAHDVIGALGVRKKLIVVIAPLVPALAALFAR